MNQRQNLYITDRLQGALSEVFGYIIGISSSLAILALAVCAIRYMTADDTQSLAQVKQDVKNVLIAWILINMVGAIINTAIFLISNIEI